MIDLWIKDKYTGAIHKIGDDPHDCLMVDEEGTVSYYNLQCGDGCKGYKSVNKETLADKYPNTDWGKRSGEYTSGYEFVPNMDEYGYPYDPTGRSDRMTNQEAIDKMEFCKRAYQKMIDENSQEGVFVGKGFEGKWKADTPLYKVYEDMRDACDMSIKALENIGHLTDRPCSVCEFHKENGCCKWDCVFEGV